MSQHLTSANLRTIFDPTLAAAKSVTSITKANPAVCTSTAHGYAAGDYIFLTAPSVDAAMGPALYRISAADANTFTVPYNNSGGTGGAQTASALKVTAGLVQKLKPYQIKAIMDALSRKAHNEAPDAANGTGESDLDTLFPSGGPNF